LGAESGWDDDARASDRAQLQYPCTPISCHQIVALAGQGHRKQKRITRIKAAFTNAKKPFRQERLKGFCTFKFSNWH
jgi:hypothetical protein